MKLLALTLAAGTLLAPRLSDACAKATPRGEEVQIADEEAVIVWDPATRTEQFIRRARFSSTTKSFGFLVPTPTVPQLGEVTGNIFWSLQHAIRPAVEHDTSGFDVRFGSLLWEACELGMMKGASDDARAVSAVRVISTAHVAGFDATTVEADDATALAGWLAGHGFATTPQLTDWLAHYVNEKWKITAFVVASDQTEGQSFDLATRAVKMTFQTERPFYPYREPIEVPAAKLPAANDRTLRVYFLSNQHYQARLAEAPWHARVLYSAPVALDTELAALAGPNPTASVFIDEQAPRKGIDELYFMPAASQADIKQPPFIIKDPTKILIPLDVILLVALIGWRISVRRKRRRAVKS